MVRIVRDWSEGVDWSTVEYHKTEFHNHPHGDENRAEAYDVYLDAGYTVFATGVEARNPIAYPASDFNRDPESDGVVFYPSAEQRRSEHQCSLFTKIVHDDFSKFPVSRQQQAREVVEATNLYEPDALLTVEHPARYTDDPTDTNRWRDEIARWPGRFLGFSSLHKSDLEENIEIWENALNAWAPQRIPWILAVDDPGGAAPWGGRGDDVDIRVTTLLLDPDDFDPSDQIGTMHAAIDSFKSGHFTASWRDSWDDGSEDPPILPRLDSVAVDEDSITLSVSDTDSIEWRSGGETIDTGETIQLDESAAPAVYACLKSNPEAETFTQPWAVLDESSISELRDAEIADAEFGTF